MSSGVAGDARRPAPLCRFCSELKSLRRSCTVAVPGGCSSCVSPAVSRARTPLGTPSKTLGLREQLPFAKLEQYCRAYLLALILLDLFGPRSLLNVDR